MDREPALQDLIDRQAITDTLYRYASTIDHHDYVTLRSVFVDDASARYGDHPSIHGADEIVAWIRAREKDWQHHLLSVYHIDITGDVASTLTYHTSHQTTVAEPDAVAVIVARYRDELRRVDGSWRIANKIMEIGWRETRHR